MKNCPKTFTAKNGEKITIPERVRRINDFLENHQGDVKAITERECDLLKRKELHKAGKSVLKHSEMVVNIGDYWNRKDTKEAYENGRKQVDIPSDNRVTKILHFNTNTRNWLYQFGVNKIIKAKSEFSIDGSKVDKDSIENQLSSKEKSKPSSVMRLNDKNLVSIGGYEL